MGPAKQVGGTPDGAGDLLASRGEAGVAGTGAGTTEDTESERGVTGRAGATRGMVEGAGVTRGTTGGAGGDHEGSSASGGTSRGGSPVLVPARETGDLQEEEKQVARQEGPPGQYQRVPSSRSPVRVWWWRKGRWTHRK